MFKKFIPFAHATSLYDIDVMFFKKLGIKVLLLDLDNTLDSYKLYTPTDRAKEFIQKIRDLGIEPVVISNNKGERVGSYADSLKLRYINSAMKPFPKKIKRFLSENSLCSDDVVFVGDQMMTDVLAAHNAKIRIILTEKLVKEDQWTTHINRIFGRPIRKHLKKKNKLTDWRMIYGKM